MLSRWTPAFRRLLSLILTWITLTALLSPSLPVMATLIVGGTFVASIRNPAGGLLVIAGLAPLGALIAGALQIGDFRLTEATVLAFFAGSMLRGWPEPRLSRAPARRIADASAVPWTAREAGGRTVAAPWYATSAAWLLAAMMAASVAGTVWQLAHVPGTLTAAARPLVVSYFTAFDHTGFVQAATLAEGLGLAAALIVLFRTRPALAVQIPAMLCASAFCACIAGMSVWSGLGFTPLSPQQAGSGYRIAAHGGDASAAGSYFAMTLCLALGMSTRDRGTKHAPWLAAAAACAVGLWLSASLAAIVTAIIVLAIAAMWLAIVRWRPALHTSALIVVIAGVVAAGVFRTCAMERGSHDFGTATRVGFIGTSSRIIAARPLFGIGIGQYYRDSRLFLSPQLAWTNGGEHAHDDFVRIASEMGLVGFGLFALWIAGALAIACKALALTAYDWRLLGALAGVIAFLATCAVGEPLLASEVAVPFWLQFGLIVALGSSAVLNRAAGTVGATDQVPVRTRYRVWTTVAAAVALMWGTLTAMRAPLAPPDSRAVEGFYEWETEADPVPVRFRWSEEYASVFVPGGVARLEIPVRLPREELHRSPMGIEASIDGAFRVRAVAHEHWTAIALDLPATTPPNDVNRVNLKVDRTWRPALVIPGSADMRSVGVQVGAYRVLRVRGDVNARRSAAPR